MDDLQRLQESPLLFAVLLGIQVTGAAPDQMTAELMVRDNLCTQPAIRHSGAIMAVADTLGAAATMLKPPAGASTTTIESKTNLLAPALAGKKILGETTPVHRGRRMMVYGKPIL